MQKRFFIEVAYLGTAYAGFQVQQNGKTIQGEIENALLTFFRKKIELTGSSRTDAGVHARQNFFHTDMDLAEDDLNKAVYHINSILPRDIVLKSIMPVAENAHCRFDAISRYYVYSVHTNKDPFVENTSHYFPYAINNEILMQAADLIIRYKDFASFSKKNSQAKTTICTIIKSEWKLKNEKLFYHVEGNRFLRGMVKGLVSTMLLVARGKMTLEKFENLLKDPVIASAYFYVPSKGLCLEAVRFANDQF